MLTWWQIPVFVAVLPILLIMKYLKYDFAKADKTEESETQEKIKQYCKIQEESFLFERERILSPTINLKHVLHLIDIEHHSYVVNELGA